MIRPVVVLDTNILINGSNDESSYAFRIITEVIEGRLDAFATHQTMSENRQMLRKLVRDREYRELLEEFFRKLNIVGNNSPPPLSYSKRGGEGELLSDPEDVKLFESAVASGAQYLITEDQEVLAVGEYEGTEVVTPQDFWAKHKGEEDDSAWGDWAKMLMGK